MYFFFSENPCYKETDTTNYVKYIANIDIRAQNNQLCIFAFLGQRNLHRML